MSFTFLVSSPLLPPHPSNPFSYFKLIYLCSLPLRGDGNFLGKNFTNGKEYLRRGGVIFFDFVYFLPCFVLFFI